jgi:hypothetical protein
VAIPADALLRLTGRFSAGGGGGAQPGMGIQPGYETLNHISQQHQDTPPNRDIVIPARYQGGGVVDLPPAEQLAQEHERPHQLTHPIMHKSVAFRRNITPQPSTAPRPIPMSPQFATDATGNPSWAPTRDGGTTGMEETAPDNMYQGGGVVDPYNQRQLMAYQSAMAAVRPQMQTARPIYNAQMLMRPPQRLSGYAGELGGGYQEGGVAAGPDSDPNAALMAMLSSQFGGGGGYQEGGIVDPKTGKVERNYAREGAGDYNYVDPRAKGVPASAPMAIYNPMTKGESGYAGLSPADVAFFSQRPELGPVHTLAGQTYDVTGGQLVPREVSDYGGGDGSYTPMTPEEGAAFAKALQESGGFQGGGVVYPGGMMLDQQTGLPTVGGIQAPQQQASAVAGEPSKKQAPPQQAQGPQKYEFGPPGMYTAPGWLIAKEQEAAQTAQTAQTARAAQGAQGAKAMKQGGVIPREFFQHLADGGIVKDVTPDHLLMLALGAKFGLSAGQAKKQLGNRA